MRFAVAGFSPAGRMGAKAEHAKLNFLVFIISNAFI